MLVRRATRKLLAPLAVLLVMQTAAAAQGSADARIRLGDKSYEQMAYAEAIEHYEVAADKGAVNEHVTKRLADCYLRLGNTEEAEKWYAITVKFLNREPQDLYNYAQALKSNGKYKEAEEWMDQYLLTTMREGAPRRSNISDFAKKFMYDIDRWEVRAVSTNTAVSDFGTTWLDDDRVIFASARNERVGVQRTAAWNAQPFLDLYFAQRTEAGDLVNATALEGNVNSKLHEGPAVVSQDVSTIWFTRNNLFKGKAQKSNNGIARLAIYKAEWINKEWSTTEQFLYNNSECSVGHPALSRDGKRLYFVSDMPGGNGGTDIYMCRDQGGQWGEPENLGPAINSPYNEAFPFIDSNGTLWFASNGHPGLGGLDVYQAKPGSDGRFMVAVNVGAPVNGPKDDFTFIIDSKGERGFFSSNRPGGKGDDDIYSFVLKRPLEDRFLCTGFVIDDEDESPVIDVEVQLLAADGTVIESTTTDTYGKYTFTVEKDKEYVVKARMKGRYDGEQHLSTERIAEQQIMARDIHMVPEAGIWLRGVARYADHLGFVQGMKVSLVNITTLFTETEMTGEGGDFDFRLTPNEEYEVLIEKQGFWRMSMPVTTVGVKQGIIDLNEAYELDFEPIGVGTAVPLKHQRWAQNSSAPDPKAKAELEQLAERLMTNPTLIVEVGVHSDSRGDADAALKLDQKRANAILDVLRSRGVAKERISAKGYGATHPVNHCVAGVQCSEEEHAANRRVEYVVTGVLE
ncbi:MAG: OmpA family protein [Flavobacteriales bacterium]|nr:OmpA family protein [Flavobacteriales bacterium]